MPAPQRNLNNFRTGIYANVPHEPSVESTPSQGFDKTDYRYSLPKIGDSSISRRVNDARRRTLKILIAQHGESVATIEEHKIKTGKNAGKTILVREIHDPYATWLHHFLNVVHLWLKAIKVTCDNTPGIGIKHETYLQWSDRAERWGKSVVKLQDEMGIKILDASDPFASFSFPEPTSEDASKSIVRPEDDTSPANDASKSAGGECSSLTEESEV